MNLLLCIVTVILNVAVVRGSEPTAINTIQLRAYYKWIDAGELTSEQFFGPGDQKLMLYVVFKNVGDSTVTIPTDFKTFGAGKGKSRDGKETLGITSGIVKSSTVSGEWNIPSIADMAPVELRKGEATQVRILAKVVEKPRDVDQITVTYSIDKRVADRFGLWSGTLRATALEIRDWMVPKN